MASDLIRMTGMISGLDTESIISAYTSTAEKKVQDAKNSLTLNTWTQDAWKSLNTKIYSFYSKTLSTDRMSSAYQKKKTTTSDGALTVTAGSNAVDGVQTAQILNTAKAGYMTGKEISLSDTSADLTDSTDGLGIAEGSAFQLETGDGETVKFQIGGSSSDSDVTVVNSMDDLVSALKNAGLNANFDTTNGRVFVNALTTGEESDFNFTATDDAGMKALGQLGIASKEVVDAYTESTGTTAAALGITEYGTKIDGENAKLKLNGATFESQTNNFTINNNTYTVNYMPEDESTEISITTATDYDGVYDVVKSMLKEYNSLVNEMSKLYNADSAKGYEPLSDEQKESMSESEIEDWETKIKDSLLRKDGTISDILNSLSTDMADGLEINGTKYYLSSFGIATQGYFEADENERYALHIDGDTDDEVSAGKEDKLKTMLASNPEDTTKFFQELSNKLYNTLYSKMSGNTKYSSIYKVYNDKQLATEATDWKKKITELEQKVKDIEDKWYTRFSRMETTLAKMQNTQSVFGS